MNFYKGTGQREDPRKEISVESKELTPENIKFARSHAGYKLVGEGKNIDNRTGLRVVRAVNTALTLGRPLLVAGEPGSGKTSLGHSISWELMKGINQDTIDDETESGAILFVTKSTTQATNLFYEYDALKDFRDEKNHDRRRYIRYTGLGLAILLALPKEERDNFFPTGGLDIKIMDPISKFDSAGALDNTTSEPDTSIKPFNLDAVYGPPMASRLRQEYSSQSVVIIDEVDKAPRDFPNDILHEIDKMTFYVSEIGEIAPRPEPEHRPIVIITSNSERQLPDPFLRRCAFVFLESPKGESLKAILKSRLPETFDPDTPLVRDMQKFFEEKLSKRDSSLEKKVSISELLDFFNALYAAGVDPKKPLAKSEDAFMDHISVLGKKTTDQDILRSLYKTFIDRQKS